MARSNAAELSSAPARGTAGRVPPHNLEAEESLLGAMLLSKDAVAVAVEKVRTEDFYKPAHGCLFSVIAGLYGAGEPVDPVTVAEALRRDGALDRVGGKQAILRIQAGTPAAANAAYYARIVADHTLLRRLAAVGGEIAELGYTLPEDVDETVDRAETLVFDVAGRRITSSLRSIHSVLADNLDQLEAMLESGDAQVGVPTGYHDLDDLLLGLAPSSMTVVAARPGQGKTSFALGIAAHVAIEVGRPVVFFSLEMSAHEVGQRLLAADAAVTSRALRTGKLSDADWAKVSQSVGRVAEAPLFIDDNPHLSVMEMRAKCRRLKAQHGDLGLVVVDYLQLMSAPKRGENRQVEVAELSRGLKVLARDLEAPVIALSQLNRSLEYRADKRPMLADLRESGALEQDSDVVCFIYRDDQYDPTSAERGRAEIIVAKNRNGPTGKTKLAFLDHLAKFANLARGGPHTL